MRHNSAPRRRLNIGRGAS
ncbi:DUF1534 domain-containing protein, partial [Pseudomonas syringae pv. actinidiae]|nr:DUF1534 domain-containing protein [Pseudomonas syringae pv. actinidiae]NVL53316.1 DUF1534 domain-containing protein [Pseudomonas syringae pv. actinidiae]NVL57618.1 DUF1534 domain-containing protein [Pseudomonas syringae pv. actinidiae]